MEIDIRMSKAGNLMPVLLRLDGQVMGCGIVDMFSVISQSALSHSIKKKLYIKAVNAEQLCQDFFTYRKETKSCRVRLKEICYENEKHTA